jgi:hypothetical protein
MPLSRLRAALQRTLDLRKALTESMPYRAISSQARLGRNSKALGCSSCQQTGLRCLTFVIQDSIMYMQCDHVMINGSEPPLPYALLCPGTCPRTKRPHSWILSSSTTGTLCELRWSTILVSFVARNSLQFQMAKQFSLMANLETVKRANSDGITTMTTRGAA